MAFVPAERRENCLRAGQSVYHVYVDLGLAIISQRNQHSPKAFSQNVLGMPRYELPGCEKSILSQALANYKKVTNHICQKQFSADMTQLLPSSYNHLEYKG
jgi:hypothetical protein